MTQESAIVAKVREVAAVLPDAVALYGDEGILLTYSNLIRQIDQCADWLRSGGAQRIAVELENGPAWAVIDLALLESGKISVPLPDFFSRAQREHLLRDAAVEQVVTTTPERYARTVDTQWMEWGGERVCLVTLERISSVLDGVAEGTCKITYTSGTTGEPKGVCIHADAMAAVVESIVVCTQVTAEDRHLSLLPLTTLLENVGGLYVALGVGASVTLLPQQRVGVQGASGVNVLRFVEQLQQQRPTTTILIPQMVNLLVNVMESMESVQHHLRFVAVGGATISESLLLRASALGLPIHEGYGLSEATSVVACNAVGENRIGTVGRPLSHVDLRIADDGEIRVRGGLFNGYLRGGQRVLDSEGYLSTGDLGHLDEEGFLVLQGRKKNLLVTAFGRNVAPEWVERELLVEAGIFQAVLFGDGRPWNVVLLVATTGVEMERAVAAVNRRLPDYARIRRWLAADEPFTVENGEWTGTARPRRAVIWERYGARIDVLYSLESEEHL